MIVIVLLQLNFRTYLLVLDAWKVMFLCMPLVFSQRQKQGG